LVFCYKELLDGWSHFPYTYSIVTQDNLKILFKQTWLGRTIYQQHMEVWGFQKKAPQNSFEKTQPMFILSSPKRFMSIRKDSYSSKG
jgi:hypothetical protein